MNSEYSCIFQAKFRDTESDKFFETIFIIPGDISDSLWHDGLQACQNHANESISLVLENLKFLGYGINIDSE